MAKFLVISAPFSGHTNPTLPLVAELVKRGHNVSCISAPKWKNRIELAGAEFIQYNDYPDNLSQIQELRRFFQAAYNTVMSLKERYDILIYDSFFYPGKEVAERLGIPYVRQMFTPAWNKEAIKKGRKDFKSWMLSWKAMMTYRIIDKLAVSREAARQMDIRGKHLVSSVINDTAELNIVYVTETFQPCREIFDDRYIFTVPGIENTRKVDIEIPYEKMIRPIIYISLGSMISSKRFLMKCIKAFDNKNVNVVISTGKVKPEELGRLPNNIYAYSFVPQLNVLQNVDLFFTHGGMNSINEAMYYGVPMLVMPITSDQPINAQRVIELQIGKSIKKFCSAKTIYKKAMEVLNDASIKANAEAIQKKVRTDIGVYGAADNIERILHKYI